MINPASIFSKLIKSAPCFHSALLHDHRELHILVDRAIQVVGARSTPGANLMAGISGELQVVRPARRPVPFRVWERHSPTGPG